MTDRQSADEDIDPRHPIESIFEHAVEKAREDGDLSVDELLDVFGARSLGPMLMIFGLIAATPPIGAIPGVPTTMGLMTLLFSVQFAIGRPRVWVPKVVADRAIGIAKLEAGQRRAHGVAMKIDALVKPRFSVLTTAPANRVIALAASALALTMPPLELVPFGVAVPGVALICFGIGLVGKDGLFALLGLLIAAVTAGMLIFAVPWAAFLSVFS